jgi:hypothetical protein
MNRRSAQYEYMALDDFEELLADKPADEKWELIGGRVVRMMVGARWEHNYLIQNISGGLRDRLRASGSSCRTLVESFRLRNRPSARRCCRMRSSIVVRSILAPPR